MDIWIFCRYFLLSQSTLLLLPHKYLVSGSILACMEFYVAFELAKACFIQGNYFLRIECVPVNECMPKQTTNKSEIQIDLHSFVGLFHLQLNSQTFFFFQENGGSNWCKKVLAEDELAYPGTEGKTRDQFKLFPPNISRSKVSRGPCKYPIGSWQLSYCFHQITEPFLII